MKERIQNWKNLIRFVQYYFSIKGLFKTLFVPWHRDTYQRESGVWGMMEYLGFMFVTRFIGFVIRFSTILAGVVVMLLLVIAFPLFLIFPIPVSFEKLSRLGSLGKTWAYPQTYFLDQHGRDMRFLPEYLVIDHDQAIERIERILSRPTQQNVLGIGPQGVGKTTRLAFLARKMYRDLSYPALNSKRLIELFPEEMTEDELRLCLHEAVNAGNIILVIENIERFNILGLLEPYLDIDHFQMILTTDIQSYNETFKHHAHLMRVSEVVEFLPPPDDITLLYLMDWCRYHGQEHRFSRETLSAIIVLTNKLIVNDYQPEKSVDVLEELVGLPYEKIEPRHVEELLTQKTGVPMGVLKSDEKDKLLHLEEVLNQHVIGQEEAIHAIASALKRARISLEDTTRPIGSFLFLGTTGVGKTYTAKMLAEYYFGPDSMIRFDMSEFRNISEMNRFMEELGAAIEQRPYALVFFDEIEKAHPDILNLFLQILDEGFFHTPSGRKIPFQNTIIIMTSNAGATYLMENEIESLEPLIDHIVSEGILRPEFINRFDAVVLYRPLKREEVKRVARLMMEQLNTTLEKRHGIRVALDDDLLDYLARKGHNYQFGLRPLKRVIQDDVETAIADSILADDIPDDGIIHLHFDRSSEKKVL